MVQKLNGFTLWETLVSLLIVSMLSLFALVSYHALIAKNKTQQTSQTLLHYLQFARIQAISRHQTITVCPSRTGDHCDDDWYQGVMIYQEPFRQMSSLEKEMILVFDNEFGSQSKITWNRMEHRIRFDENGMLASQPGSLTICNNNVAKQISISLTGRARVNDLNDNSMCLP